MNNLKKYAGLLNDEAPKNHLLAYITPSERDMLIDAGGIKTPTPSGIFAYPPGGGDWGGSMSESGGGGGGKGDNDGNNRNTNYGISPGRSMAQYGTAKYAGLTETVARDRNSQDQRIAQQKITQQKADKAKAIAAEQDRQKRAREAAAAAKERTRIQKGISEASANAVDPGVAGSWSENKKTGKFEFTPSTDTITSFSDNLKANLKSNPFGYLTPTSTMLSTGIQTLTANAMMGNLGFNVNRGDRGGQNNNQGDRGEGNNQTQAFQNQLTALAPYLLTNTVAPKSQVLEYFSNKNTNSNFDFAKDYASAKSKVAQTLNNRGSMGMLAVTDSPYYDWLKTKGLDKGIL